MVVQWDLWCLEFTLCIHLLVGDFIGNSNSFVNYNFIIAQSHTIHSELQESASPGFLDSQLTNDNRCT